MAKEITGYVKLQVKGGAANPAPPIGPALGAKGVISWTFVSSLMRVPKISGKVLPVVITVYQTSRLILSSKRLLLQSQLLMLVKLKSGSAEPN